MPQQFHFPLQQILDLRKMQEERVALELAQEEMRLETQSRQLQQLRGQLETAEQAQAGQKKTSSSELWLWLRYRDRISQDINQAQQELQKQMQKVKESREELASKSQELKKMERLKEKQALEHKQLQEQKEQKELDEMGSLLHQKRYF
jgi:flagellar FliJ protein